MQLVPKTSNMKMKVIFICMLVVSFSAKDGFYLAGAEVSVAVAGAVALALAAAFLWCLL